MNKNKKLIDELKEEMNQIKDKHDKLEEENKEMKKKFLPENKDDIESKFINDKLLNIIINKDKKIEQLINQNNDNITKDNIDNIKNEEEQLNVINNYQELKINDHIIESRDYDKYVNATQLCKAGGKKFNDWYRLDSTKELINELANNLKELDKKIINNNARISASQLKINKSTKKSNMKIQIYDKSDKSPDTGNPATVINNIDKLIEKHIGSNDKTIKILGYIQI